MISAVRNDGDDAAVARRAIKPRSTIVTLYGDYLRYCGELRLSALTDLFAESGIDPASARTAMSRLRAEGWFLTRRDGRQTLYRLSEEGLRILDDGLRRIFVHRPGTWDGQWTMLATRTALRSTRDAVRADLAWRGFGPLQPGLWLAPGDRRDALAPLLRDHGDLSADSFLSRTGSLEADRGLAAQCWRLPTIDAAYLRFLEEHRDRGEPASTLDALARRVRLTGDFRRFPFTDPDLPADLLPADWHGRAAHAAFAELHEALRPAAEKAVASVLGAPVVGSHRVVADDRGLDLARQA